MELITQALVQGILLGSALGLVALGANVFYSVSGVVNFAHGHFMILAMYAALALQTWLSMGPYFSAMIVVPGMFVLGLLVHRYLITRVRDRHVLFVAQVTLGVAFVIQGLMLVLFGGDAKRVHSRFSGDNIRIGILSISVPMLVAAALSAVLAVGFFLLLNRTDFGRSVRAVHQNRAAARSMGVNIGRVEALTFGLGLGLVGIAGIALAPTTPFLPITGLEYTLMTFLIMILGGMGNFIGNFVGGLLIGVATACGQVYLDGAIAQMLPYLLFVVVVLWRPKGLLMRGAIA